MHLFKMKSISWYHNNKSVFKRVLAIIALGIIYLVWYRLTNIGLPCIFHEITNLYCPGCGVTRMFLGLFELDFVKVFKSNCLVFLLLPYGIFAFIRHYTYLIFKEERYPYKKFHKVILIVILILTIAFGVARNIPCFYFLRPSN